MIELKGVSKYYHTGDVISMGLHNVNLSFNTGEIVAIVGESGSGKSTLLNVITKLDSFDEGEIYYKGNETSYFSISDMDDFRKNKIGFIFQNSNIIDSYTVLENVMLPLVLKGMKSKEAKKRALELIDKVGLSHRIKSRGTKLSGGEKQRCVIARALASDCEILACDEPTGNLDSKTGADIIQLIKEVAKDKLVLIVTHNFDQVKDIATRKIRVNDGQILEDEYITKVEDDEPVELDLDYQPLKKKVCAKVAKNNVLFTPKKTILLILVFLSVCFGSLFMFQSISNSSDDFSVESRYINKKSNRNYVYKIDHSSIDLNQLKGYSYDINPFYEDKSVDCTFPQDVQYSRNISCYYSDRISTELIFGKYPTAEDEIFLSFPKSSFSGSDYSYESMIDKQLEIGTKSSTFGTFPSYKVSGVGIGNENAITISGNTKVRNIMQQIIIFEKLNLVVNQGFYQIKYVYDKNVNKPTIYYDIDLKYSSDEIIYKNMYDFSTFFELKKASEKTDDFNYSSLSFHFGDQIPQDMPIYEASVYGNYNFLRAKLGSSYGVDNCSKLSSQTIYEILAYNIQIIFLILFASISLIIVFFITYVILARVYVSKKKDYEILRTLGITQKDMRHIVNFEVCGVGAIVTIFSYIAFNILITTNRYLYFMGKVSLLISIYYFLAMSIFVYFVARRFNRRLFKFSVSKSLKGGDFND